MATTFWIAPEKLRGWHNPFYRPASWPFGCKLTLENNVVVAEPGGWAVLMLFSAWTHEREPRFPFDGALDEISIHRAALASTDLSFSADCAPEPRVKLGALTGRYTTALCDWGQLVRVTALRTTTALHDGTITAQIETSNDEFKTIAETQQIELGAGERTVALSTLTPARLARVVFTLTTPADAQRSPLLADVELTAVLP